MPSESGVTSRSSRSLTSPDEDPGLDGGADRHDLVGVDALVGLLAEELLHQLLDLRDAGRAADQHDLVDLRTARAPASFRHCRTGPIVFSRRSPTSCSSFARVSFSERCFGPEASAVTKGRLISVSIVVRQLALGLLRGLLQPLQRHLVLREVDPLVLLELRDDPLDHALVEVVAAEVGVAVRGLHLDDALAHLEDRDVEGAAAEVVDRDRLVLLLVEAVGEGGRGRLVDDAQHLEARRSGRRPWWPGAASR